MRIASDTPKIIIQTLAKVDVSKVSDKRMEELYNAGSSMLKKYSKFTRSLSNISMIDIKVDERIPQKFGNLLSQINYSGLNFITRKTAEQLMLNWVNENLPMRK